MYHAHTITVSDDSITISGDDLAQAACLPPLSPNSRLCLTPWIGTLGLTLNDQRILSGGRCLTANHISAAQSLLRELFPSQARHGLQDTHLLQVKRVWKPIPQNFVQVIYVDPQWRIQRGIPGCHGSPLSG